MLENAICALPSNVDLGWALLGKVLSGPGSRRYSEEASLASEHTHFVITLLCVAFIRGDTSLIQHTGHLPALLSLLEHSAMPALKRSEVRFLFIRKTVIPSE